jgi:endonuclease G
MSIVKKIAILAGVFMVSSISVASASPTNCPQFYVDGQAPDIINPKVASDTVELCHSGYSTRYSGVVLAPLYSADILTREHVEEGRGGGRHGSFHVENSLPFNMQLSPRDYQNSNGSFYDRGHMVPNGDMWTPYLQEETFSMSNMIVQDADNNEGLHEGIEVAVRNLAIQNGQIATVTGPIFYGNQLKRLNGKAFIPTMIYKAVYIPGIGASAYIENNMPGMTYSVVSINTLTQLIGIDVFPSMPSNVKDMVIDLPVPTPSFHGGSREARQLGIREGSPQLVSLQELINIGTSSVNSYQNTENQYMNNNNQYHGNGILHQTGRELLHSFLKRW